MLEWLSTEPRRDVQDRVLAVIAQLLEEPAAVESEQLPGPRADMRVTFVPDTDVALTYLVVDQYRVVALREIWTLTGPHALTAANTRSSATGGGMWSARFVALLCRGDRVAVFWSRYREFKASSVAVDRARLETRNLCGPCAGPWPRSSPSV